MRWLWIIIISLLMFSCAPKVEKEKPEAVAETVISREDAIASLPCFGCHSYARFSGEPKKGIFSHKIHVDTGYHCNQCHDVIGHEQMTINRDICNNCHGIKSMTLSRTAFPSNFNHKSHAAMLNCKECHPGLFLMASGSAYVTMKDIYNGAYCGACHNGKKAFSSSECSKCHKMTEFKKELVYKIEGFGPVEFSHKFHTMAFSCNDCHPKLFEMKKTKGKMTMDAMYQGKLCGACHNGTMASAATDCGKCHK